MSGTASGTGDKPSEERPDPQQVQTVPELKHALKTLRGTRTYKQLDRAAGGALAGSTVNNLLNGSSVPTKDTLVTFLAACGLATNDQQPWLAAWERVSTGHLRAPVGAIRVRQARPRLLGVHAAIRVEGATGELPPYVPRDLDADLRTAVTVASVSGGFVLLVGGSSVGKTRALFEAVRTVVPEWWLLHPADTAALDTFAAEPAPRTVVWLDEMQRYLDHPGCMRAGVLRSLVAGGVVVVATLWPDEYGSRTARRVPGQPDAYANDRELLGLADMFTVPEALSEGERRRAETLAADGRIRTALDTPDAGFTQVLAAGPALANHWENAPTDQCYGKAVITAALDARRVGATAPLTRDLLGAAAPGYLTPAQQATAPVDWLDRALAYATTPLHGAASTLVPVPAGMGRIAGYAVADYLHQHARRVRRTAALPDLVWQALVDHHHPDDSARLADNAKRRGRPHEAVALYRRADRNDKIAAIRLATLLVEQGHVDELRARAEAGDFAAASTLGELLAEQGRIDEALVVTQAQADAGYWTMPDRLVELLVEQCRVDELRARVDSGNWYAGYLLADMLVERGNLDELRARADAGDFAAASGLRRLLAEQGRIDEAFALLQTHADAGDRAAAERLAELLVERGDVDELRARADAGDWSAASGLGRLLAEQGQIDEALALLQSQAEAGDGASAEQLVKLLVEQGRVDEAMVILRTWADAGDGAATEQLAELLVEQGSVDEAMVILRSYADAGDGAAAVRLSELLVEQGSVDEAMVILRTYADTDADDGVAAVRLSQLLVEQNRIDELTAEVAAGTPGAVDALHKITGQITGQSDGRSSSSTT